MTHATGFSRAPCTPLGPIWDQAPSDIWHGRQEMVMHVRFGTVFDQGGEWFPDRWAGKREVTEAKTENSRAAVQDFGRETTGRM